MNRKERRRAEKIGAAAPPPDSAAHWLAQAVARHQVGALAEAQAAYARVLALQPDHADAHYGLGLTFHTQGRLEQAAASYRNVLARRPGHMEALSNLGIMLKELGQFEEAEAMCRRALGVDPVASRALGNLGAVLFERGKLDEAAAVLGEALTLDPNHHWSLCNLASVRERQEKLDEAIALARRAVAQAPDSAPAHFNLAVALAAQGALGEAIDAFGRVLALAPQLGEAHLGLAHAYLLRDDFESGWREYEWRWSLKEYAWIREIPGIMQKPRWSGEDIADKTILLCVEQGLGDTLQFIRYAPLVVARAGRVVLLAQPALQALIGTIPGVTMVGAAPAEFDVYCPLLSLPRVFATTAATIPGQTRYIKAEAAAVDRWRARLGVHGLRIGIAWQGKPKVKIDLGRSIPLAAFAPLARLPGARLISLQKNDGVEQLAALPEGMQVEALGHDFDRGPGAFLDTAAVMMSLDLIVTSDSAIAHLAGALGRPIWVALKAVPDWRWGLATPRSPWYPSMRLFRQNVAGDWNGPFAEMASALAPLAADRIASS